MGRFGAQAQLIAVAVGCGVIGACLYSAVLLGTPGGLILVYLTQLPLFVAGLWLGTTAVAIAGATACIVMLALSDVIAAALFAALNAGPVVLVVRQALLARSAPDGALRWYPPGLLMGWLTALALGGVAVTLLLLGGPDGLQAGVREVVGHALDRITDQRIPQRDQIAATVALVMPGIVAASWMVMAVINGSLAQGVLARFGAAWRPSPDLAALTLPSWITILLGLAAAATAFGGPSRFVGINTMIALSVPFCLAGLAVLHAAVRRLTHPAVALVIFYTVAAMFGWPLLIVAVLGLLENWLGLRRRLIPSGGQIDG
jgi:hypothetical protein